jgi:acid phosphatase
MTNDGHDTDITVAANWARNWLAPLLNNTYFMNNTLILLTFDETELYTTHNVVYSILLGGALPTALHNTTDDTFYTHYSTISSVSANWGLPSLGRWDCNANVFQTVANATNYDNYIVDTTNLYFNITYPGPLSDNAYSPDWAVPNTLAKCASGQGVLPSIAKTWGQSNGTYNYTSPYPYDDAANVNVGGSATLGPAPSATGSSTSGTATSSTSPGSSSPTKNASPAVGVQVGTSGVVALVGALLALL